MDDSIQVIARRRWIPRQLRRVATDNESLFSVRDQGGSARSLTHD